MVQGLPARALHWLFQASLILKGGFAASETVSGLGLLVTPTGAIGHWIAWLAHHELAADDADRLVSLLHHMSGANVVGSQHFYALYLLFHGMLKLAMVTALGRKIPLAYPMSMVILGGFVAYQLTSFLQGGPPILGILSALDAMMIALVWREYRLLPPQTAADRSL